MASSLFLPLKSLIFVILALTATCVSNAHASVFLHSDVAPGAVVVATNPQGGGLGFNIQLNLSPDPTLTDPNFTNLTVGGDIFLSSSASFVSGQVAATVLGVPQFFEIGAGGNFRDFNSLIFPIPVGAWNFQVFLLNIVYSDIYTYGFCLDPFDCTADKVVGTFQDVISIRPIDKLFITPFSVELPPDTSATPLPAALPLFAGGLGVIGMLARRRKQRQAASA